MYSREDRGDNVKYRMLDQNDDYTFGRRNEFYSGVEAVAQAVKTRLRLLKGEWWENIEDGTPLFQEVEGQFFASVDDIARVDLVFAERITGTQGVVEITEFESELNPHTRTYSASITINTIYGERFRVDVSSAGGGVVGVALRGGYTNGIL
jgi:hypothetical protein